MREDIITMLVAVPRWTEPEIVAVGIADRLATWREADLYAVDGTTEISLDVEAADDDEARQLVRAALGDLPDEAFLATTA